MSETHPRYVRVETLGEPTRYVPVHAFGRPNAQGVAPVIPLPHPAGPPTVTPAAAGLPDELYAAAFELLDVGEMTLSLLANAANGKPPALLLMPVTRAWVDASERLLRILAASLDASATEREDRP